MTAPERQARRPRRGFARAGKLVERQIRKAGEDRGFAVAQVLTHWAEIAGPDLAGLCRPVRVGYGRGGLGATLTVLASGAAAPLVQQQLPKLRDRVNACYGYNAVAHIRVTQTAGEGFAAPPQAAYQAPPAPDHAPADAARAADLAQGVSDPALRDALAGLGQNVLARRKN